MGGMVVLMCMATPLAAQFKKFIASPVYLAPQPSPFLTSDKITQNYLLSPLLTTAPASRNHLGDTYWMGQVTTQSYNQGKLGTFYYWDVQGNLRETKFFIDIAGGKKRGLKIVIPRRFN